MHELLTPREMGEADHTTIAAGTPGITLMERAGLAVADEIATCLPFGTKISVFCGPGNNGGDGFVVARLLRQRGYPVRVGLVGDRARIAGDAALALEACPLEIEAAGTDLVEWAGCIVDALFGAGLTRAIEGGAADLIEAINASNAEVVAVDLPSGVDGRDGQVRGAAIIAERTVTFFRKKPGHCLQPGKSQCGFVRVADIGIPVEVLGTIGIGLCENNPGVWADWWHPPVIDAHKYSRGHCVAISGPVASTGAIRLAARASLRVGSGLVSIATPSSALIVHASHATAIMTKVADTRDQLDDLLNDARVRSAIVGPGLGLTDSGREQVTGVLASNVAAVLDADALSLFTDAPDDLFSQIEARLPAATILTPHEGEFRRLFPDLASDPALSKIDKARAAAHRSRAFVLYKGPDTVIAGPGGKAVVHHDSSAWLATAGSGDVLAGLIAGILAQSVPPLEATCMGAFIHSEAAKKAGPGLIAEDLVEAVKPVIESIDADRRAGIL